MILIFEISAPITSESTVCILAPLSLVVRMFLKNLTIIKRKIDIFIQQPIDHEQANKTISMETRPHRDQNQARSDTIVISLTTRLVQSYRDV